MYKNNAKTSSLSNWCCSLTDPLRTPNWFPYILLVNTKFSKLNFLNNAQRHSLFQINFSILISTTMLLHGVDTDGRTTSQHHLISHYIYKWNYDLLNMKSSDAQGINPQVVKTEVTGAIGGNTKIFSKIIYSL